MFGKDIVLERPLQSLGFACQLVLRILLLDEAPQMNRECEML